MRSGTVKLALFCAAAVFPLAAQEVPPQALPVPEPLEPVEEPAVPVPSGGNVPAPEDKLRATSRSGMFRVSGGDQAKRGSVALLLEQSKDDFEALMRDRDTDAEKQAAKKAAFFEAERGGLDDFKVPVNVEIVPGAGNETVDYSLRFTPDQFVLGIRVHMDRGIDHELLGRAALTILLYERALRDVTPGEFSDPLVVRPWLVEGLAEAAKWRAGRADRRIYEGVFKRGGGFTMEELFELTDKSYRQLDGASRLAFQALSGALVMALLEQPEGRGAFRAFAGEAARFAGEMPMLLRKHFPDLNLSERSLAKWWALTLARLVQPPLTEVLPIRDTELALDEALQFHSRDADGNAVKRGIDGWEAVADLERFEREEAVRPAEDGLVRLSYRCFPSYRSTIEKYQQILRDIAGGGRDGIAERLQELQEERRVRVERALRARDYMDYFEISRARNLSGEFDDYLRLKKELELKPRPQRKDRITDYLDILQKSYEPRPKR